LGRVIEDGWIKLIHERMRRRRAHHHRGSRCTYMASALLAPRPSPRKSTRPSTGSMHGYGYGYGSVKSIVLICCIHLGWGGQGLRGPAYISIFYNVLRRRLSSAWLRAPAHPRHLYTHIIAYSLRPYTYIYTYTVYTSPACFSSCFVSDFVSSCFSRTKSLRQYRTPSSCCLLFPFCFPSLVSRLLFLVSS